MQAGNEESSQIALVEIPYAQSAASDAGYTHCHVLYWYKPNKFGADGARLITQVEHILLINNYASQEMQFSKSKGGDISTS